MDLLSNRKISHIGVECLENINSWIMFPTAVEFYTSADGKTYTLAGKVDNTVYPALYERYNDFTINEFA